MHSIEKLLMLILHRLWVLVQSDPNLLLQVHSPQQVFANLPYFRLQLLGKASNFLLCAVNFVFDLDNSFEVFFVFQFDFLDRLLKTLAECKHIHWIRLYLLLLVSLKFKWQRLQLLFNTSDGGVHLVCIGVVCRRSVAAHQRQSAILSVHWRLLPSVTSSNLFLVCL